MKLDLDAFAQNWLQAWNDQDLEALLDLYADEIVFYSPRIAEITGSPAAQLEGKIALRTYWRKALAQAPKVFFELDSVLKSGSALTLLYTNHRDQQAAETFIFNPAGKVKVAVIAYA